MLLHLEMGGVKGTIDITQMVFKGVPLEKAEQKELWDVEDESTYQDYWGRGRFIHEKIEELLMLKQHQLIPMYLMGEIRGGTSIVDKR